MERSESVVAKLALPIKAILFDFDGTLFELKVDWLRVRQELKGLLKFPGSAAEFKPLRPRIQEIVRTLPKGKELEQEAYAIISRYEVSGAKKGYPHEGAKEVLQWLKNQGIKTVILTRNTRDCVLPVLEKYQWPRPELIVAREDVKKEKPDPEAGLLALEKLQLQPQDCLIVGDSLPDFEMAGKLEIRSVLVFNPRHEFLPKDQADFFIQDLWELGSLISSI